MSFLGFGRMGNSARDDELNARDRDRISQKRRKVIRSAHEPLIPFICRILFVCMIGAPVLDIVMELVTRSGSENPSPVRQFAVTLSWSALVIWLFFAAILLILAYFMLIRTVRNGYVDRKYYFEDEIPKGEQLSSFDQEEQPEIDPVKDADLILYSKPVSYDTKKKYLRYILISGIGSLVLAAVYFICVKAAS